MVNHLAKEVARKKKVTLSNGMTVDILTKVITVARVGSKVVAPNKITLFSYDGEIWVRDLRNTPLPVVYAEKHITQVGGKETFLINRINKKPSREVGKKYVKNRKDKSPNPPFARVTDYGEGRAPKVRKVHKHRCDVCSEALGRTYTYVCMCDTPYLRRKHDMCVKVLAMAGRRRRAKLNPKPLKVTSVGDLVSKINKDRIA